MFHSAAGGVVFFILTHGAGLITVVFIAGGLTFPDTMATAMVGEYAPGGDFGLCCDNLRANFDKKDRR